MQVGAKKGIIKKKSEYVAVKRDSAFHEQREACTSTLRERDGLQLTRLYPTLKSARPGQNILDVLADMIPFLWVSLLMLMAMLLLNSILR
jgi:hypothetical protein